MGSAPKVILQTSYFPFSMRSYSDNNKTDKKLKFHEELNTLIETSKNTYTQHIEKIDGNLELFLGIDAKVSGDKKAQVILLAYESGKISRDKIDAFAEIVQRCLKN